MLPKPTSERATTHYGDGHWRTETIYDLAAARAQVTPDAWAVRDRIRRLTYREFVEAADALAADLAGHGLQPGDRVGIWLPSRVEGAIAILACSRNGYVCSPGLQRDHTVEQVLGLLRRMSASALILQPNYGADADRRDIAPGLKALGHLRHGALERRERRGVEVLEGLALFDLGPRGAGAQREDALVFGYSRLERRLARGLLARVHLPQLARRPAEEPRELGFGEVRVDPPRRVAEPHAQHEAALVL